MKNYSLTINCLGFLKQLFSSWHFVTVGGLLRSKQHMDVVDVHYLLDTLKWVDSIISTLFGLTKKNRNALTANHQLLQKWRVLATRCGLFVSKTG